MSITKKRKLFWSIWSLLIVSAPLTVVINSNLEKTFSDSILLSNFFQRISGLLGFMMISMQIILGSNMSWWIQILGAKAYKIHITQGVFTYLIILVHPLFQSIITYQLSRNLIDSFSIIFPKFASEYELLLVFGKTALLLLTITFLTGFFRTSQFLRRNWIKFHILNYFIFYLVFFHMRVGSDIMNPPFLFISWAALLLVSLSFYNKFFRESFTRLFSRKDLLNKTLKA